MFKAYYNFMSNYLVKRVLFFDFPKIIDKYYQYGTDNVSDGDFSAFKSDNGIIDIYYKNFHVFIVNNDKDKIVSISLKKDEDKWEINKDNPSKPITKTFEIYRWYDVTVYDTDKFMNERYVDGSWNKYFYKTLKDLDKYVNNMTVKNQMYQEYSHIK